MNMTRALWVVFLLVLGVILYECGITNLILWAGEWLKWIISAIADFRPEDLPTDENGNRGIPFIPFI